MSISLIQAYSAEGREQERFQKQNLKSLDAEIRTAQLSKSFKRATQITIAGRHLRWSSTSGRAG